MTKSNNSDAFRIHYSMMTTSGVWPMEKPNIYYKLKTLLTWIFSIGLCVGMWMEVIDAIPDFSRLSKILYVLVNVTAYLIKLVVFTYRKDIFLNMIRHLKDPIFSSYPDDVDHYMAKTINLSTLLANIYRYLVLCCSVLYLFFPILDNQPLPFPFPYDLGKYTPLMYGFQLMGESCAAWNNSSLDTLCTSLMGIAAAQLDILAEKIVRFGVNTVRKSSDISDKSNKDAINELKQCVEHHLAIIKFIDLIEQTFTMGLFAQFIASVIVVCNTLFHFVLIKISSEFFMLVNYFIIILMQLFIYCWYGNEILFKSVRLGQACYMSNWQFRGKKVREYLFLIMEQSKRPLNITTMKFSILSLRTFASVLQWSYSCLALLLKVYNKGTTIDVK